jgi:uncharacterized protein YcbK (DUF882 family)
MISEHFKRSEFACECGCGFDTVDTELLIALELIRNHFDVPVMVDSGCRCKHRNEVVGGKSHSYHLIGRAADIRVKDIDPGIVYEYANQMFAEIYGLICYNTFLHIDTRTGSKYRMGPK